LGLCALSVGLAADTLGVSSQTTQLSQPGDSLVLFTDSSYALHASALGMMTSPSQIFFNLVSLPIASGSLPVTTAGQFTVERESAAGSGDGSVSSLLSASERWTNGRVQTSLYSGPASLLMSSLSLSSTLSQEFFASSEAQFVLTYTGPDITVGPPGNSLEQDLTISLAGPISVGAMDYDAAFSSGLSSFSGSPAILANVPTIIGDVQSITAPEPDSSVMLFSTGVLLCVASVALKRFGRRRS
jgi:hypothetical protein